MKELIISISIVFAVFMIVIGLIYKSYIDLRKIRLNFKLPKPKMGVYQPVIDRTTSPPPGNETHMRKAYIDLIENLSEDGLICDLRVSIEDYVDGYMDPLYKTQYKLDINRSDFYDHRKPELKVRTKLRLIEISNLGMEEMGCAQFGYKGVMSGLYIEHVWNYSDDQFKDYIEWVISLIDENTKNS